MCISRPFKTHRWRKIAITLIDSCLHQKQNAPNSCESWDVR